VDRKNRRDHRTASGKRPLAGTFRLEFLERVTGIEPAFSAWEADVLPLNYTRRSDRKDIAAVQVDRRRFI
jgi:hypothetical protein